MKAVSISSVCGKRNTTHTVVQHCVRPGSLLSCVNPLSPYLRKAHTVEKREGTLRSRKIDTQE